jgi:poly(ADP-ribose) glycohydrolase ARH3
MPTRPDLRDRIRGALVGAVIGDAFGSPLEGAGKNEAARLAASRAVNRGPWGFTDDAMMFVALAESIRDTGTVSPVHLLTAFSNRYEPARGFGRGMKLAINAFRTGTPWREVARVAWPEGSRGNGGAVRVGAVALRSWQTRPDLLAAATIATRVTHAHPEAIEMALLHASLVALVLLDPDVIGSPGEALIRLEKEVSATPFVQETFSKIRTVVLTSGDVDIARVCGTSTLARESVPAAHSSFFKSHGTFRDAIVAAASLGGDVDSICALVGCLAGALHGIAGIPSDWVAAISHESPSPTELLALADDCYETFATT